jgi:hypothetical protein
VVIFSHVLSLILLCLIKPLCFSRCQYCNCHMIFETVTWPLETDRVIFSGAASKFYLYFENDRDKCECSRV